MSILLWDNTLLAWFSMPPIFFNVTKHLLLCGFTCNHVLPIFFRYLKDILKGDTTRLKKFKLNIEDPPRRKHLVFIGGAVLGDVQKNRHEFWATKEEWEEEGARILHKFR